MRHSNRLRAKAVGLFDEGHAEAYVGSRLCLSKSTIREWLHIYKTFGKEALFVTKCKSYSQEFKVQVVKAVLEDEISKSEAMRRYGLRSRTQINDWCKLYLEGGEAALLPKKKGRPKKSERIFSSREEELEARIQELELENEILKRINALVDEIEQR